MYLYPEIGGSSGLGPAGRDAGLSLRPWDPLQTVGSQPESVPHLLRASHSLKRERVSQGRDPGPQFAGLDLSCPSQSKLQDMPYPHTGVPSEDCDQVMTGLIGFRRENSPKGPNNGLRPLSSPGSGTFLYPPFPTLPDPREP